MIGWIVAAAVAITLAFLLSHPARTATTRQLVEDPRDGGAEK